MSLPRWHPELNTIYRAETLEHLSVAFLGGRTGTVEVLVGDVDPPTELAGTLEAHSIGATLGVILRPGEFWMLVAGTNRRGTTVSVSSTVTPLV